MTMWRKTLEYLGLVEEAEEFAEMPERREATGERVRPAMHDTTGPIEVVRADERRDRDLRERDVAVGESRLRPVNDLTEPVAVVGDGGRGRGEGRGGRGRGEGGGRSASTEPRESSQRPAPRPSAAGDNVRQLRPDPAGLAGGLGPRVAIVAVADYEGGAREVGQRYRQGVPVLFDLTDAPVDDRRRVLDFVTGVTYALHGEMVKVGPRAFLIVPEGGEVSSGEWDRLAGLGYRP